MKLLEELIFSLSTLFSYLTIPLDSKVSTSFFALGTVLLLYIVIVRGDPGVSFLPFDLSRCQGLSPGASRSPLNPAALSWCQRFSSDPSGSTLVPGAISWRQRLSPPSSYSIPVSEALTWSQQLAPSASGSFLFLFSFSIFSVEVCLITDQEDNSVYLADKKIDGWNIGTHESHYRQWCHF